MKKRITTTTTLTIRIAEKETERQRETNAFKRHIVSRWEKWRSRKRTKEERTRERERKRDPKSAHHVVPDVKVFVLFLRHCVFVCVFVSCSLGFYARVALDIDVFFSNFDFPEAQNLRALLINIKEIHRHNDMAFRFPRS